MNFVSIFFMAILSFHLPYKLSWKRSLYDKMVFELNLSFPAHTDSLIRPGLVHYVASQYRIE